MSFIYNLLNGNKLRYNDNLEENIFYKGDMVKVSNFKERFWVEVIIVKNNYVIGRVDNYITQKNAYNFNSIILFNTSNILDFIKKYS